MIINTISITIIIITFIIKNTGISSTLNPLLILNIINNKLGIIYFISFVINNIKNDDIISTSIPIIGLNKKLYIVINDKGSRKSLNRYMIDEKIPSQYRDSMLLLCDGNHVMYVVGHRISEYYKVNDDTRRILRVQITGEDIDE